MRASNSCHGIRLKFEARLDGLKVQFSNIDQGLKGQSFDRAAEGNG